MAETRVKDLSFLSQIRTEYMSGYFRRKPGWMTFASRVAKDFEVLPGKIVSIPYFNITGDAGTVEEGAEIPLDPLGDASFQAEANIATKGIGITDFARVGSGFTDMEWDDEAIRQVAQVLAYKAEDDILAEISKDGEHDVNGAVENVTLSTAFGSDKGYRDDALKYQKCTAANMMERMIDAFGDKHDECVGVVMHSKHVSDFMTDRESGFLKADAVSPFQGLKSYVGTLTGGATIFQLDTVPLAEKVTITDSAAAEQKYQAYNVVMFKRDPFGFMLKRKPTFEKFRKAQSLTDAMVASQWYAIKSFHKKISDDDVRIVYAPFITSLKTT